MKLLALAALLALATPAAADTKAAAAHYKQGKAFFDAKVYDQAIAEYQQAYAADGKSAHLYNIARAYHLAGDPKHALEYYQKFLAADPDSPIAAQAREYVTVATKEVSDAEAKQREAEEAAKQAAAQQQAAAEQEHRKVAATSHVRQAEAFAKAGTWTDAGAEYTAAADADGDAAHLLDAGAAYRKAPDLAKARDAYRAYLTKVPLGGQSDAARANVAELTRAIDKAEQDAREAKLRASLVAVPVVPPPHEVKPHHTSFGKGWFVVGGALILSGLVADFAPPNAKNGQLDASDFAGPVLYGLGAGAILAGVF